MLPLVLFAATFVFTDAYIYLVQTHHSDAACTTVTGATSVVPGVCPTTSSGHKVTCTATAMSILPSGSSSCSGTAVLHTFTLGQCVQAFGENMTYVQATSSDNYYIKVVYANNGGEAFYASGVCRKVGAAQGMKFTASSSTQATYAYWTASDTCSGTAFVSVTVTPGLQTSSALSGQTVTIHTADSTNTCGSSGSALTSASIFSRVTIATLAPVLLIAAW